MHSDFYIMCKYMYIMIQPRAKADVIVEKACSIVQQHISGHSFLVFSKHRDLEVGNTYTPLLFSSLCISSFTTQYNVLSNV